MAVEEGDVDGEPHADRVDGGAAREEQGRVGWKLGEKRESEQPRAEGARDKHPRAARVGSLGKPPESRS